jgi:hypothetical protein
VALDHLLNRAGLVAACLVLVVAIPFFALTTAFAALLNVLLILISVWYFPGDGPYAEAVVELLPYLAVTALPVAALANRHVGEWAELRRVALHEVVMARVEGVEWRELDVPFRFSGLATPVHLCGSATAQLRLGFRRPRAASRPARSRPSRETGRPRH